MIRIIEFAQQGARDQTRPQRPDAARTHTISDHLRRRFVTRRSVTDTPFHHTHRVMLPCVRQRKVQIARNTQHIPTMSRPRPNRVPPMSDHTQAHCSEHMRMGAVARSRGDSRLPTKSKKQMCAEEAS